MARRISVLGLICILSLLTGCGYHLGGKQPPQMAGVKNIYVPMPKNLTAYPRLEAQAANHLIDALIADGQYRISSFEDADAKLTTTISAVSYRQLRPSRRDLLRPEELQMEVNVSWNVLSLKGDTHRTLLSGSKKGRTRYFQDPNLQTAQRNAFPDALSRVSRDIVATISNGLNL